MVEFMRKAKQQLGETCFEVSYLIGTLIGTVCDYVVLNFVHQIAEDSHQILVMVAISIFIVGRLFCRTLTIIQSIKTIIREISKKDEG